MKKFNYFILILMFGLMLIGCDEELNHTHSYIGTVVAPTCVNNGYTKYICSCGNTYNDNYVEALGHTYGEWGVVKEATETEEGLKEKVCSVCNDKVNEVIVKLSHTHLYSGKIISPTCIEKGYTIYTCECGDTYNENEVEALGHIYTEWQITKEATETEKGLKQKICIRCYDVVLEELPKLTHTHSYIETKVEPTCTEQGYTTYTCSCGESQEKTIAALGHDLIEHNEKEATCTEVGWKSYSTCSRCSHSTYEEIPAGHSLGKWIQINTNEERRDCQKEDCNYYEIRKIDDCTSDNNAISPQETYGYIGNQSDDLVLTNSINIDNKYYVYYFYLGSIERSPLYSTPSHQYTFDTEMTFEFQTITSEQITESLSKATEKIDTHSYTGGFSIGFEQTVELGADFIGTDMNMNFTTTQSTDHHWTNNWGNVITTSMLKENSYLTQNTETYKYTYQMSEQNGFTKGYYYRATFYENISVYGVLIYDINSQASTEAEKYTVVYQTFLNADKPTYVLEESKDNKFTYKEGSAITFDVDKAINIASSNEPTNVEISTSYEVHIRNVYDMYLLNQDTKGKTFILDTDIDFSGLPWNPINIFEGTLDGNEKCIKNLEFKLYDGAVGEWGLFKTISSDAIVKNLTMQNCSAKYIAPGKGYAVSNVKLGFLATYNYGEISNCTFSSNNIDIDANTKVVSQYVYCGIVVCDNYGYIRHTTSSNNSIDLDCDSVSSDSADDKSTVAIAGGICAYNQREGYISESTATNNVIYTRVCYLADEGEDVRSTSSGAAAWNYGHLISNTCENNTLTAIKRYYKAKWFFSNFIGTEYKGEEKQSCGQECTRNYGN